MCTTTDDVQRKLMEDGIDDSMLRQEPGQIGVVPRPRRWFAAAAAIRPSLRSSADRVPTSPPSHDASSRATVGPPALAVCALTVPVRRT